MFILDKITRLRTRFERNSPFGLTFALARALLALSTLLTLAVNTTDTLFPASLLKATPRSYVDSITLYHTLFYQNLVGYKLFALLILAAVISGWRPRITGVLHWWVSYTFFMTSDLVDGGDQINAILCLILVPLTLLDSRPNHWNFSVLAQQATPYKNIVGNSLISLAGVQMCYLYFQAAVDKLKVSQWVDGTSLYYWTTHNVFGAPDWLQTILHPITHNGVTLLLTTWLVLVLEALLAAAIVMGKSRKLSLLAVGIVFHLGIALTHGLISFFFSMSGGLVLYLLPRHKKYNVRFTEVRGWLVELLAALTGSLRNWKLQGASLLTEPSLLKRFGAALAKPKKALPR
ncbi:sporulation-delaying protein SdpB family protein [Hymenobacter chitinivorans]|uniref:Antimicrobial peptide system SdpB family protein n=1 Tax=Hymenobacter chitinivorans DSM 11115 TaxID=1121954 RepID=A0A2M9AQT0_9BACT|nr:sporulation-delaying protein SdpB family protein [Hymenobacter chitinivorans]PJJ48050.1 antimicrobial peptide system SdpB family protein [Hymenobacter chitinivorans DSM 11115]